MVVHGGGTDWLISVCCYLPTVCGVEWSCNSEKMNRHYSLMHVSLRPMHTHIHREREGEREKAFTFFFVQDRKCMSNMKC